MKTLLTIVTLGEWGDVNRQYQEHKTWMLTPILGLTVQHLGTFKEYPVRQLGLSGDVGKTIEGIQSQILRMQNIE